MEFMMAKKEADSTLSVLERLRQLDAQRAELADEAKSAALAQAEAAVEILHSLGFPYEVSLRGSRPQAASSSGSRKGTRQVDPNRACPICEFRTDPPHDARRHRSQGEEKQPFSLEQLMELGLRRVD